MLTTLTFLGLAGISALIVMIGLVAILVFEIAMFVSVLQNQRINDSRRLWWILGMVLLHPFVAIVYYFTDHKS